MFRSLATKAVTAAREPMRRGNMQNEAAVVARYPKAQPLTNPGDLLVMDFLVLHESGDNVPNKPRWTMQLRYFNFNDPTGRRLGWAGSFSASSDCETFSLNSSPQRGTGTVEWCPPSLPRLPSRPRGSRPRLSCACADHREPPHRYADSRLRLQRLWALSVARSARSRGLL